MTKRDKQVQARKSTAKAVLSNIHALRQRRYVGDLDASDTLLDLQTAIANANLTQRQAEALWLVYGEDLTQEKAGERLGTSQTSVAKLVQRTEQRIDMTYEKWTKLETEDGQL